LAGKAIASSSLSDIVVVLQVADLLQDLLELLQALPYSHLLGPPILVHLTFVSLVRSFLISYYFLKIFMIWQIFKTDLLSMASIATPSLSRWKNA